jgi:Methyltransferase domain
MLHTAYRSIVRKLPVSVKAPLKRLGRSMAGNPSVKPQGVVPVTPPADPLKSRIEFAESYFQAARSEIPRWAHNSRESENFTFDLTQQSLEYLAATVSVVTGAGIDAISAYLEEPRADLSDYLSLRAAALPIDKPTSFGRRLGWYAIARAMKPRVTIETGVHYGLGSVLLCSALRRNAQEGHPGRYYGTDIDPGAGVLLAEPLNQYGKILYGDSIASLRGIDESIDLFINDSDHSAEYEGQEYRLVEPRLSQKSIVLGDNSHVTNELFKFSVSTGRNFLFFKETPRDHWYPGAGIGISFSRG